MLDTNVYESTASYFKTEKVRKTDVFRVKIHSTEPKYDSRFSYPFRLNAEKFKLRRVKPNVALQKLQRRYDR